MESGLVSWQYENFSSAELIVSPPVSPNPPSPSFYNANSAQQDQEKGHCNRALQAAVLLNQLEQEHQNGESLLTFLVGHLFVSDDKIQRDLKMRYAFAKRILNQK